MSTHAPFPDSPEYSENSTGFNTGKLHGLTNKYEEITRQRKSLLDLNEVTIGQLDKMMEQINKKKELLKNELIALEATKCRLFIDAQETLTDLLRIFKKKLDNEATDSERMKEKTTQLYKEIEDRLMLEIEQIIAVIKAKERHTSTFEKTITDANDSFNSRHAEFIKKLDRIYAVIAETERGFWYGNAVREGL